MQSNDELKEIFEKTLANISKPMSQDDIEFLLIDNGLETDLKKGVFAEFMNNCGFVKKQVMKDKVRELRWLKNGVNNSTEISKKRSFLNFMREFLKDKEIVEMKDINAALLNNGLDIALLNPHLFESDGLNRFWNGWKVVRLDGRNVYKKLTPKQSQTA